MVILNLVVSSIFQLLLFLFIPFIVYLIGHKRIKGFFTYLGVKKIKKESFMMAILFAILGLVLFALPMAYLYFIGALNTENLVANQFMSIQSPIVLGAAILINAMIKTSLSEELFFRGFLAKRLIAKLGYKKGNLIQAIIFGSIHGALFIGYGVPAMLISIIMPAILGYLICYLNERKCEGSIIAGWIVHGLANSISFTVTIIIIKLIQ